jgi:hypothetical protein
MEVYYYLHFFFNNPERRTRKRRDRCVPGGYTLTPSRFSISSASFVGS